jgi:4-hydroxy-tetrahydrodipicolinate synthase
MKSLSGLSAFPITPSDSGGRIDTVALRRLVARLRKAHVDAIGLLGSTGSYVYLTREERRRAVEAAVDEAGSEIPIIVGVGALRTDDAVKCAEDARAIGATAGLLAAVSYTPLTDDEVFEHFATVARDSGLRICIYDNPATTHFRFTPELVARLSRVPEIVGVKSPAAGRDETIAHLATLRRLVPEGFSLGYSADWNSVEALIAGADTWYSVLGGLLPKICVKAVKAAQQGDGAEARRLDAALMPVWDLFKRFSSLRVIYELAEMLDVCRAEPPRPILRLSDAARRQVAETLKHLPAEVTEQ